MNKYKHKLKKCHFLNLSLNGLEYEYLKNMNSFEPKVICFKINEGLDVQYKKIIPNEIAQHNIGQSLFVYNELLEKRNYFPLCYTGYIFFVKKEYKPKFDYALSNKKLMTTMLEKKEVNTEVFNKETVDKLKEIDTNEFPEEKEYTDKLDKIYFEYIKYLFFYKQNYAWQLNNFFCKREVKFGDKLVLKNNFYIDFVRIIT